MASCRLHHAGETTPLEAAAADDISYNPFQSLVPTLQPPLESKTFIKLIHQSDTAARAIASVLPPDCKNTLLGAPELDIRLVIHSYFGKHEAGLSLKGVLGQEVVDISIEDARLSFPLTDSSRGYLAENICRSLTIKPDSSEIIVDDLAVELLRGFVERIAPDCDLLSPQTNGWDCKLPLADPELARQELTGIRSTMVRRWSRQPYLLARRLAVGLSLAEAMQSRDIDRQLDIFCNIVRNSLPLELPATLASKRWQDGTCGLAPRSRHEAALFGLSKTVAEIDFLRQLFERTSRLGSLRVRIPGDLLPTRLVFVSLTPADDVAENLARETSRIWTADSTNDMSTPIELPRSCWHPVYGEDADLLQLARHLTLAGDAEDVVCAKAKTASHDNGFSLERYLADSITSETEFIMPNGRSKTLRLPAGSYTYTLQGLPENPDDWDDAATTGAQSSGAIVWDSNKPRALIDQW